MASLAMIGPTQACEVFSLHRGVRGAEGEKIMTEANFTMIDFLFFL